MISRQSYAIFGNQAQHLRTAYTIEKALYSNAFKLVSRSGLEPLTRRLKELCTKGRLFVFKWFFRVLPFFLDSKKTATTTIQKTTTSELRHIYPTPTTGGAL